MDAKALESYCDAWLAAWTGRDAEPLLAYYADDCAYLDPAKPDGLRGKDALRRYLTRLLQAAPDMVWTRRALYPVDGGFFVTYDARVTANGDVVRMKGADLVLLDGEGRIARNEVYFDRTEWMAKLGKRV